MKAPPFLLTLLDINIISLVMRMSRRNLLKINAYSRSKMLIKKIAKIKENLRLVKFVFARIVLTLFTYMHIDSPVS